MIKHHNVTQNTKAWLQARCGVLTASNMRLLFTPSLKPSNNEALRQHVLSVATERLTGIVEDLPQSWDMKRGHYEEIHARRLYNEISTTEAKEWGFVTNDKFGFNIGCSPDGMVDQDGLIEIKCVINRRQVKVILDDVVPNEYMLQIQAAMMVTERKWCDFISYSNGMPMFVKRVEPVEELQEMIAEGARKFEEDVGKVIKEYKANSFLYATAERLDLHRLVK